MFRRLWQKDHTTPIKETCWEAKKISEDIGKKTSSRNLKKWFRKLSTFSCPCFWHLLRPRWLCSEDTSQVPYLGSPLIPPLVAGSPLFGTCSGWKKNNPAKLLETFTFPPRIFYNFWCPFFAQKKRCTSNSRSWHSTLHKMELSKYGPA